MDGPTHELRRSRHCSCATERDSATTQTFQVAPDAGGGWPAWTRALGHLFDRLAFRPTHCVVITQWPNERYVQLMVGHGRVHVEASSNRYLRGGFRLDTAEEARLRLLGFADPGEIADGMPENWWIESPFTSGPLLAELITATLLTVIAFAGRWPIELDVFGADEPCVGCAWDRPMSA